jgi:hypothetical protein
MCPNCDVEKTVTIGGLQGTMNIQPTLQELCMALSSDVATIYRIRQNVHWQSHEDYGNPSSPRLSGPNLKQSSWGWLWASGDRPTAWCHVQIDAIWNSSYRPCQRGLLYRIFAKMQINLSGMNNSILFGGDIHKNRVSSLYTQSNKVWKV